MWTVVEVNLAVICCSMPALRPLLSRWFPGLFGTDFSGRISEPYGGGAAGAPSRLASGRNRGRSNNHESHQMDSIVRELHPTARKQTRTEIRGVSPSGSEEEIMTYNGILRTTNFNIRYDGTKPSDAGSSVSSDVPRAVS